VFASATIASSCSVAASPPFGYFEAGGVAIAPHDSIAVAHRSIEQATDIVCGSV
jgi:hypothetical protein